MTAEIVAAAFDSGEYDPLMTIIALPSRLACDDAGTLNKVFSYIYKRLPHVVATQENADLATSKGVATEDMLTPNWGGDMRGLIRMGWMPCDVDEYDVYMYLKYTDEVLSEFYDMAVTRQHIPYVISTTFFWNFKPIGVLKEEGLVDGNGLMLGILAPDLVYKSGRPKTDMSIFRNSNSNRVSKDEIVGDQWGEWKVIPVTRYAAGMTRSRYYNDMTKKQEYCGTFYYYEPESTTYLAYKKAFRSFNKTTAIKKLGVTDEKLLEKMDLAKSMTRVTRHINGAEPRDLIYTYELEDGSKVEYYAGRRYYAAEDYLDQDLCKVAAAAGYDIVILEAMVGSFQVVTEVLDVRSRQDSFLSLLYTY